MEHSLGSHCIRNGQKLTFQLWWVWNVHLGIFSNCRTKMPLLTPLSHFPPFHFLFPTQLHFINILLFIFFHFTNIKLTLIHFTIIKPTSKRKKKRWRKVPMFNEGLSNYFARYNNFILLISYLFLNILEYEVNLFLFVSFFFHLSLNMMWIILIFF